MIAFIDAHRDRFGVEPICRVLSEHGCKIAPNTCWVARKRPPSKRSCRDAELVVEIRRVYADNLSVYGADKVWTQLNREGIRVARCTVERLIRAEGLSGTRRGKTFKVTTHADDRQQRPADLVERRFRAPAPNRLWVADLTYVKTHCGWVYVAFIIDVYIVRQPPERWCDNMCRCGHSFCCSSLFRRSCGAARSVRPISRVDGRWHRGDSGARGAPPGSPLAALRGRDRRHGA